MGEGGEIPANITSWPNEKIRKERKKKKKKGRRSQLSHLRARRVERKGEKKKDWSSLTSNYGDTEGRD